MEIHREFLKCILLLHVFFSSEALQFSLIRNPNNRYCGALTCSTDVTDRRKLISNEGLTIYDITAREKWSKLAEININAPGVYLDKTKVFDASAFGEITLTSANLSVQLRSYNYCLERTFRCRLQYTDFRGQLKFVQADVSPQRWSSDDLTQPTASLSNTEDIQKGLGDLNLKLTSLEKTLSEQKQYDQLLMNSLLELSKKQAVVSQTVDHLLIVINSAHNLNNIPSIIPPPNHKLPPHSQELSSCYRGMPQKYARQLIKIYGSLTVLCDTETDGGGWIVLQRRAKGDTSFYRGWNDYKNGFGDAHSDYWIGNEVIHNLTSNGFNELRIEIGIEGEKYFAHYTYFKVEDEESGYALTAIGYSGTSLDTLNSNDVGTKFSTYDRDNDNDYLNCASHYRSAWWYNTCFNNVCTVLFPSKSWQNVCHDLSLNGVWKSNENIATQEWTGGISGFTQSLAYSEIKVRSV